MAAASSSASSSKPASSFNVNASSMMSLLSEVSKHTDGSKVAKGGARKRGNREMDGSGSLSGKTAAIFDRKNRGLAERSAKDRSHMLKREDLSAEARRVLEAREKMEHKAKLYEQLVKGETVQGVTLDQVRQGLLVDFETKAIEESYKDRRRGEDSDSDNYAEDSGDEGKATAKAEDAEELVETTDDLGRTRWIRRSQLAASARDNGSGAAFDRIGAHEGGKAIFSTDIKLASESWHPADNQFTYYGDQAEFPVYEPSADEIAARRKAMNLDAPLAAHFDSSKDFRTRGAGYMQLSQDEETRKKQMEDLQNTRLETEQQREKMTAEGDAAARRAKELDDRKRLVEEKKRQVLEKRKALETERDKAKQARTT